MLFKVSWLSNMAANLSRQLVIKEAACVKRGTQTKLFTWNCSEMNMKEAALMIVQLWRFGQIATVSDKNISKFM